MERLKGSMQAVWFFKHLFVLAIVNFPVIAGYTQAASAGVAYVPQTTKKICQLTGDYDNDVNFQKPTVNTTNARFGVLGTDLGSSFTHNGKIYFLFGDTRNSKYSYVQQALDSIAYTTHDIATAKANKNSKIDLTFNTVSGDSTKFQPPVVEKPSIDQGGCSVPTEGLSANGKMYVYFVTGNMCDNKIASSILAASSDNGLTFDNLYDFSSSKFVNVQVEVVENTSSTAYNGIRQLLPADMQTQQVIFIWGSGNPYRGSSPYLAYLPLSSIEDTSKSQLRYFKGLDAFSKPIWSTANNETDAQPLFNQPCIGEFSVSWNPYLKKWLMLFNCWGINFRVADYPWGPWSESQVLFNPDPDVDKGYCYFMHTWDCEGGAGSGCDDNYDALQQDRDNNTDCRSGGAYGPYVISSFTDGIADSYSTIYFTLSTWNPYQVMLMKSTLEVVPTVTSPENGEDWEMGSTQTIAWTAADITGNAVEIGLYGLHGGCVPTLEPFTTTSNTGSYSWKVPLKAYTGCSIWITSNTGIQKASGTFNIVSGTSTTTTSIRTTTTSSRTTSSTTTSINQAPVWDSAFQNKTVNENVTLSYYIPTATDPQGNTVTYSCTQKPSGANFYPLTRLFQWKPDYDTVPPGQTSKSFTVTVTAKDPSGNSREGSFTVTVNNVNQAPSVTANMSYDGTYLNLGETVYLTAAGKDADTNDTLEYYWERGMSSTQLGEKTWSMIRNWSTASSCSYKTYIPNVWLQFRCTVRDMSGATATDATFFIVKVWDGGID